MLPSVTHVFGERNFIFQDDNCRVHRARVVREFLDEQGGRTLPWPSKSPDINPIENNWGRMTSIMYKNVFRPNTVEQLQQKIIDTCHEISPEYTRELVSSMPRRLQMVIDNNGAMTKY
jgi:transposase